MRKIDSRSTVEVRSTVVFQHLTQVQVASIALASLLAALTLVMDGLPLPGALTEWFQMPAAAALSALAGAVGLALSLPGASREKFVMGRVAAIAVLAPMALEFLQPQRQAWSDVQAGSNPILHTPVPWQLTFVFLAIVLLFLHSRAGWRSWVADTAAFALSFTVLTEVSQRLLAVTALNPAPEPMQGSATALIILMLLSFVAFGRRAEYGVGAILVGSGIGSRIARGIAPLLLALPYVREMGRGIILRSHLLPDHKLVALLASIAAMISLGLLIVVSWRIDSMEEEIRDLGLRDELTGLYNLRGFRLLAEQALLMARRTHSPFAVLFIDMDDLKLINDQLGHKAGSAYISTTGEILKEVFRDSDVVGRIGGDEFAVAGQFTSTAISIALSRLEHAVETTRIGGGREFRLSLSSGYVASGEHAQESLQELLDRADAAMYEEKRKKKMMEQLAGEIEQFTVRSS